jgi:hypothetical protein
MKFLTVPLAVALTAAVCAVPALAASDPGGASPSLSFFSGGGSAYAGWVEDADDSDGDGQDIRIHTTTLSTGYAGVEVHHVYGIPTAAYPNSSYEVKSDYNGASQGSPRLVVRFSDGGNGALRPLVNTTDWQHVADPNWDNTGGTCGFRFEVNWADIQNCHVGTFVTDVYMIADPLGHTHWIDELNTDGETFTTGADNGS